MSDQNKQIVRRMYEEVFDKRNFAVTEELMSPDYVLHDPTAPNFSGGREGYKKFQSMYLNAFPDHHLTIDDQIADGDKVVTRWSTKGTHKGDLPNIPATGKVLRVTGITISRLADGKIVEEWQNWDTLGMLQQLGVVEAQK